MPSAASLDRQILHQASLPKARQWLAWLQYHEDHLPADHGWERCVRDTLVGLHHVIAIAARRLRGNPTWDLQGTMTQDTEKLEDQAMRVLSRFNQLNRKNVPTAFLPVLDCLFGALRQQVRLAREIDEMRDKGNLTVDVLVDVKNESAVEQL